MVLSELAPRGFPTKNDAVELEVGTTVHIMLYLIWLIFVKRDAYVVFGGGL